MLQRLKKGENVGNKSGVGGGQYYWGQGVGKNTSKLLENLTSLAQLGILTWYNA